MISYHAQASPVGELAPLWSPHHFINTHHVQASPVGDLALLIHAAQDLGAAGHNDAAAGLRWGWISK